MKTAAAAFVRRAHAKLNLRLEVGERLGPLHSLVSVVASLELADRLLFSPSPEGFGVTCEALAIPEQDNIVWRAARELEVPPPPVRIVIVKRIPVQAGLGGGSADAAAALLGIARLLHAAGRALGPDAIREAATRAGSDVSSALLPGLKIVAGVGHSVKPCECTPPAWGVLLLKPHIGSATARAYALLDRANGSRRLTDSSFDRARAMCAAFEAHDFPQFLALLHNDFSPTIDEALPEIAFARERLLGAGAAGTIVCGSGSCVAGFFENRTAARAARERLAVSTGEWSAVTSFHV